ncbi:radical SAM protein [Klebsiella huaxiensis]|uniref:Radical SAM protein n=1 Tax=Klebsiella huaxiensis TaxID=2153354 RepID=A0ABT6EH46_9ENTR|nr:radical SAM protein [Klebsiella huaxiensis]MDG1643052.1 radical SAM protein [Klebsiella huaxiensis]QBG08530.1 radical SAM protein [Klebsiella huaxiensis]VUS67352.1 Antilisterial bacteriocin subtilosin biosynthesis protein AlbA [Klebsiella huaxiensis]
MRLSNSIRILKGAKRFALYNLEHSFVEPISLLQANILQVLASGKVAKYSSLGVSRNEFWSAIWSLKKLGAFRAGRPQKIDIEFNTQETSFKLSRLKQAWIEVTNSCNLSCAHCYSESSPKVDRSDKLSFESWKIIIEKLARQGVDLITIIGGEPLVRQRLVKELIIYIKDNHPEIKVNIFSNLTLLPPNKEFISTLKKYNIRVGTSLYGIDESTHDAMTKRNGSWKKTTANIDELTRSGIDVFAGYYRQLNCTLEKKQIVEFIESLGVFDYEISSPSQVGRGKDTEWKILNLENTLPQRKYFGYSPPGKNIQVHNCYADRFSINQAGEVLPCIMTRNISYGNIINSNLEDVIKSANYKKYSTLSKDKIDGCKDCEFKYGCFDCRPDAQNGSGNILRKPDCGYSPYDEL